MSTLKSVPEISVIISCVNKGVYLERCIRSLTHQELIQPDDFELIVVRESNDNVSARMVEQMSGLDQLRVLPDHPGESISNLVNLGIQHSLGRFVVCINSDDYVLRQFMYLGRFYLNKNRKYLAAACDYYAVNENEEVTTQIDCENNPIDYGIFYRKEALYDLGLYDGDFKSKINLGALRKHFSNQKSIGHLQFPLYKLSKQK